MIAIHKAIMANANDRENALYTAAKTDKARDTIVAGVEARIAKGAAIPKGAVAISSIAAIANEAKPSAPVVLPSAPIIAPKTPKPLKLAPPSQGAKPSNGVTVVAKPEAPAPKAPPVVAPPKPSAAPSVAPKAPEAPKPSQTSSTPVPTPAAAFSPFWGVMLIGGSILAPVKVTGSRVVGKGDKARPVHVATAYGVDVEAPDAITVDGLSPMSPLVGTAATEGGVVIDQHNARFSDMECDVSEVLTAPKGATIASLCTAVNRIVVAVWTPMKALPTVGSVVRFYDPLAGSRTAPGTSRPIDVTVAAVTGETVTGTYGEKGEPFTADMKVGTGKFYGIPVPHGTPLLRSVFDREWSARAVLYRALSTTRDHATMAALDSAASTARVYPPAGADGLTF